LKHLIYIVIAAAALGALAFCDQCGVAGRALAAADALAPTSPPPDLVIDFLGASRGFVEPCGCVTGQYGGIARWATFLNQSRKENPAELALFAGGVRVGKGDVNDQQTIALWKGYTAMGFNVATVSSEDLPDVEAMPAATQALLSLANVTKMNGTAIASPVQYKTVTLRSGAKVVVAVIGLLGVSPYGTPPNPDNSPAELPWKVSSPAAALKALVPEVRKKADIVVVMLSGTRAPARQLAKDIPGIDIMIAGLEGNVDQVVEYVGPTALVQNPDRGRFAGHLGITLDKAKRPAGYTLKVVPMDSRLPDDPEMAQIVQAYRSRLTVPAPDSTPLLESFANSQWAGSFVCASCHEKEFAQWKLTKHSVAMVALEKKDGGQPSRRIDCVPCHVVGYGKPGGYVIDLPRAALRGVGCEDCHGAAAEHVNARQKGVTDTSKLIRVPVKADCVTCHNRDNSPNFDFRTYMKRITHTLAAPAA
jgi:hypothetical protein